MASNLDCLNALADMIVAAIAPYQPGSGASVAGSIPNTVVGPGRPMQYPVTTTLEQGNAQVGLYMGKVAKPLSFLSNTVYSTQGATSGAVTNIYQQTGRDLSQLIVEVWAYKPEQRDSLANLIRGSMGDATRLNMPDGTVAVLKWANTIEHDEEQVDSIWITQIWFMADITRTLLIGSGQDLGTGYVVTEVDTFVQPEDDAGNAVGSPVEVIVPNPTGDPNGT